MMHSPTHTNHRSGQSTHRRDWLMEAGSAVALSAVGGLSWPGLLQARAAAAETLAGRAKIKACIFVFFYGGPSHLETWDLKPNAPVEIRGEFKPIATSVPGLQIGEHLPKLAQRMHKIALIRSMSHANRLHDSASIQTFTGRPSPNGDREEFAPIEQFFPTLGSSLAYAWRDRQLDVPCVTLPWLFHNVVDVPCQGGGFLGRAYDPLLVTGDAAQVAYRAIIQGQAPDWTIERIGQRRDLVAALQDANQRRVQVAAADRLRAAYDRAFDLLSSRKLQDAIDVTREDRKVRERYGFSTVDAASPSAADQKARMLRGQNYLLARRLVEAGVPFVNVHDFRQQGQNWDSHADNFKQHRDKLLPPVDHGLSTLIDDLDERGLLESTLVVATGEFGRTPKINGNAGRDHWPDCYSVMLAGGGVAGGAVWGASDRLGAYPDQHPTTPGDLAATIFWRFGIPADTELRDSSNRPFRLADGHPLTALFGA